MIRATELGGRAVVDIDAAEKLGRIDRVVLDPEARAVAGFVVSRGSSLLKKSGEHLMVPASCVHAVGPDAVTVHWDASPAPDEPSLDKLPRVSDMVGRKVVSDQGRLLGTVDDVLIDEMDGRIIGYALTNAHDSLKGLVSSDGDRREPYLRADADLRAGRDLIVAPEDAISADYEVIDTPPAVTPEAASTPRGWRTPPPTVSSPWVGDAEPVPPGINSSRTNL